MSSFHSMNKEIKANELSLIVENWSHYLRLSSILCKGKQLDDGIFTHACTSRKRSVSQTFVENTVYKLQMTKD